MSHENAAPRVSTSELHAREFWTATQCARVLGRGADYWRAAFDQGHVEGYDEMVGGKRRRYLNSASARAHLQSRCNRTVARFSGIESSAARDTVERFFSTPGAVV